MASPSATLSVSGSTVLTRSSRCLSFGVVDVGKLADQHGMLQHLAAALVAAADGGAVVVEAAARALVFELERHRVIERREVKFLAKLGHELAGFRLTLLAAERRGHDEPGAVVFGERVVGVGVGRDAACGA